jgi:hypothetical protein
MLQSQYSMYRCILLVIVICFIWLHMINNNKLSIPYIKIELKIVSICKINQIIELLKQYLHLFKQFPNPNKMTLKLLSLILQDYTFQYYNIINLYIIFM